MRAHFLLGPAGSGKTCRCVAEVRAALAADPDGAPLLFLAPKQATFQLERQLLADPALAGYTRLRILSFERLARFVLEALGAPRPALLGDEGRLMVLRALLSRSREQLSVFRASARLAGFASQLDVTLRELQRHQVTPDQLDQLAAEAAGNSALAGKLADLALLLRAYLDWLAAHGLQDADCLLDVATQAIRSGSGAGRPPLPVAALWLDGFAEMTPQELDLLAAVLPGCERATLAFCLEAEPPRAPHWLSIWTPVGRSCRQIRDRVAAAGGQIEVESLRRRETETRFVASPVLRHLEAHWAEPVPFATAPTGGLRVVSCANPVQEATFAAREILRLVREQGFRFREIAVLVRSLENRKAALRRVFRRHGIPFFLDHRESVAHHPLAELTRNALRTVAAGWRNDDWFGALKTGLVPAEDAAIDGLENEALARGWSGSSTWLAPLASSDPLRGAVSRFEALRARLVPPFAQLGHALNAMPSGRELAAALRAFWDALQVEQQLQLWSETATDALPGTVAAQTHSAVWEQMQDWLANVAIAFPEERLPLREWLPILEAGLGQLTVGVIPPALDQVLIGAVDRSRNPDLRMVILPGFNEGVFPAPPVAPQVLTETDRAQLDAAGLELGPDARRQIGRERYYGYIACTRARERLLVTFARRDDEDRPANPSPFVAQLRRLFPQLEVEVAGQVGAMTPAGSDNADSPPAALSPEIATRLYGPELLTTSVSRLEDFASCPFKYFAGAGLRAGERERFEVDARQRGSFQHEVLRRFHERVVATGREWGDLTSDEARVAVDEIAVAVAGEFGGGLLSADEAGSLTARGLTRQLQDFVGVLVGWMRGSYRFKPQAAELQFGTRDASLPAWEIALDGGRRLALRGKVDRVDVAVGRRPGELWCVVHDYKSSVRKFDPLLFSHGIQLQLPAYLAAVCASRNSESRIRDSITEPSGLEPPEILIPAGLFYANLRGALAGGADRGEVLAGDDPGRLKAYQHRGRFQVEALDLLDARPQGAVSGQFAYKINQNGALAKTPADPLTPEDFAVLLQETERKLRDLGGAIFAGVAAVDPYQRGSSATACDQCQFQPVCRIDAWSHHFRRLTTGSAASAAPPAD